MGVSGLAGSGLAVEQQAGRTTAANPLGQGQQIFTGLHGAAIPWSPDRRALQRAAVLARQATAQPMAAVRHFHGNAAQARALMHHRKPVDQRGRQLRNGSPAPQFGVVDDRAQALLQHRQPHRSGKAIKGDHRIKAAQHRRIKDLRVIHDPDDRNAAVFDQAIQTGAVVGHADRGTVTASVAGLTAALKHIIGLIKHDHTPDSVAQHAQTQAQVAQAVFPTQGRAVLVQHHQFHGLVRSAHIALAEQGPHPFGLAQAGRATDQQMCATDCDRTALPAVMTAVRGGLQRPCQPDLGQPGIGLHVVEIQQLQGRSDQGHHQMGEDQRGLAFMHGHALTQHARHLDEAVQGIVAIRIQLE